MLIILRNTPPPPARPRPRHVPASSSGVLRGNSVEQSGHPPAPRFAKVAQRGRTAGQKRDEPSPVHPPNSLPGPHPP